MELIQSFIAIAEAAAEQQAPQKNTKSTVVADQSPQSPESAVIEALLFKKPPATIRTEPQK